MKLWIWVAVGAALYFLTRPRAEARRRTVGDDPLEALARATSGGLGFRGDFEDRSVGGALGGAIGNTWEAGGPGVRGMLLK